MGMFHQRAESLRLNGLGPARRFFAGLLAECDPRREHLWVAHIDEQSRCIHMTRFDGSDGHASMPMREVVTDAAAHGSAGIILAHNHPSGDPSPSRADEIVTRRIIEAADLMQIHFHDHVIIGKPSPGRNAYFSFREAGIIR